MVLVGPSPGPVGRPFLWALHKGQPRYIHTITGLEFPVDLPSDPSWVSRMKQKFSGVRNRGFQKMEVIFRGVKTKVEEEWLVAALI